MNCCWIKSKYTLQFIYRICKLRAKGWFPLECAARYSDMDTIFRLHVHICTGWTHIVKCTPDNCNRSTHSLQEAALPLRHNCLFFFCTVLLSMQAGIVCKYNKHNSMWNQHMFQFCSWSFMQPITAWHF